MGEKYYFPHIKSRLPDATNLEIEILNMETKLIFYPKPQLKLMDKMRYGYGCGDQGHRKAVKSLNKAAKIIWMKAFGYNAHYDLSF